MRFMELGLRTAILATILVTSTVDVSEVIMAEVDSEVFVVRLWLLEDLQTMPLQGLGLQVSQTEEEDVRRVAISNFTCEPSWADGSPRGHGVERPVRRNIGLGLGVIVSGSSCGLVSVTQNLPDSPCLGPAHCRRPYPFSSDANPVSSTAQVITPIPNPPSSSSGWPS